MKTKAILFSLLMAVLIKYSSPSFLRKEYIGRCQYKEALISNPVNDIVTLLCSDTDPPKNKVFPPTSAYLECDNQRKVNGYLAGNVHFQNDCQMARIKYNISTVFRSFHSLNISGIELQYLPSSFLTGAILLKTLTASHNRLLEIPSYQLSKIPFLTDVDYSHNKINRIDGDAFSGVSSALKKLNLSYNHLTELHPNFFASLSKLEVLDLSYNSIEHLVPFANLSKLVHLNLSFNNIKDFPDTMILSQPNLQFLSLSHNNLTQLKMETFAKQISLHLLDLSDNSIIKMDFNATRMEHLETFHINNNQLTDLDGFKHLQFPILNSFAINGNKFNCSYLTEFLSWFDYHSSLSALHFTNATQIEEGREDEVHGIGCYNVSVSNTSPPLLVETTTIPDGTPFIRVSTPTIKVTNNILDDKTTTKHDDDNVLTTTTTTTVSLRNITDATTSAPTTHSIKHLLIVVWILVTLNAGIMIILIIRNRKSTSPMNTTTATTCYNCAYTTDIDRKFLNTAVENQYETVLIGCSRFNDSDLI